MLLMNLRKPGRTNTRRIALEAAEYFFGSDLMRLLWPMVVFSDVDDAGVGDHVLDGGARADVVAVQDGMDV